MSGQAKTTILYRTFVKGLITEAGPLTYPENASIEEENTVLSRKGSRSRRLGIQNTYKPTNPVSLNLGNQQCNEYVWQAPNNKSFISFLVVQTGSQISFYDLRQPDFISAKQPFSINLALYAAPGKTAASISTKPCSFDSGKGYLFIVNQDVEPLLVEYDNVNNVIFVNKIVIQIRDFEGLSDGLAPDQEPTTLTKEHEYNLHNAGWGHGDSKTRGYFDPFSNQYVTYAEPPSDNQPIAQYFAEFARYPSANKQWWIAKATSGDTGPPVIEQGDFLPKLLNKVASSTTATPKGHFIVDAFKIDRSFASGITGIPPEVIDERPSAVAFFEGRVWYVCNSTVYFSQVMTTKEKAGMCYQEADPTSEEISDLIATDGGVIPIPACSKGVGLVESGNGLLVFGLNGVWYISGTDGGFKATDFRVVSVMNVGSPNPRSFVSTKDTVFWWTDEGIMAMKPNTGPFGTVPGDYSNANITLTTIQKVYNEIPASERNKVKGVFDYRNNKIYWLYNNTATPNLTTYSRALILDLSLEAFGKWSFSQKENSPVYITGVFVMPILLENIGNLVYNGDERLSPVRYLTYENSDLRAAEVANTNFVDWEETPFSSFFEGGYEILDDASRKKQTPYITVISEVTDSSFIPAGNGYEPNSPSSCLFQIKWDWSVSPLSNKWTTPVEVYKYNRFMAVDNNSTPTNLVVATKHRPRGSGKAIVYRFSSDAVGKDFNILGWQPHITGNVNV